MSSKVTLKDPHILLLLSSYSNEFILECERNKNLKPSEVAPW